MIVKTLLLAVAASVVLPVLHADQSTKRTTPKSFGERFEHLKKSTRRVLQDGAVATIPGFEGFSTLEICDTLKAEAELYGEFICDCEDDTDDGVRLTCSEPDCQYCNQDFTVCGTTTYGVDIDAIMGGISSVWIDVDLMGDPPLLVHLEQSECSILEECNECRVIVGDQECNSCGFCDRYGSIELDCENVQLDGDYANFNFSANECQAYYDDDYYYYGDDYYYYGDDYHYSANHTASPSSVTEDVGMVINHGNYNNNNMDYADGNSNNSNMATEENAPEDRSHGRALEEYEDDRFGYPDREYENGDEGDWVGGEIAEQISITYPAPREQPTGNFLNTFVYGFCLPLDFEIPENDVCSKSIEVAPGSSVVGSLYGVIPNGSPRCYQSNSRPFQERDHGGIWYTVTGTGNVVHVSSSSKTAEVVLSVFEGDCDNLTCTTGISSRYNYNSETGYPHHSVAWESKESARYFLYVGSRYGSLGIFELSLFDISPSENDSCDDAITVAEADGSIIMGTLIDANTATTCSYSSPSPGVWYTVDGIEGAVIRLSTCTFVTNFQVGISLFTGDCGSLECSTSYHPVDEQRYCDFGNSIEWLADGDTTYYILIHSQYDKPQPTSIFGLSVSRFMPPDNDECSGATAVDSDYIFVEGTTLTSTSESISARCNNDYYDRGAQLNGVWYQVEGTGSGIRVSTCSEVTDYESRISVFTGSCGSFQCETAGFVDYDCLYQNPNEYGTYGSRSGYIATWISTADTTYYIFVHGYYWSQNSRGNFGLTISQFVVAENDVCSGASPIGLNNRIDDSTENALAELEWENSGISCGPNYYYFDSAPGVWYTFVGTGSGVRASTCSFGTTFETAILVFTGSCDNTTCVTGRSWDEQCLSYGATVSWITELDTTYYVLIQGSHSQAVGNFSLYFEEFEPPENDECAGAIDIEIDGDVTPGSLADATIDQFENSYCGTSVESSGAWYKVMGVDGALRASTCSALTNFDTSLSVYTGNCGMLECVAGSSYDSSYCGVSSNRYGASTVAWSAQAGVDYYILVHAKSYSSPGTFGLTVETFETAENDVCFGALPISPGSTTEGSTLNATSDFSANTNCGYLGFTSPGVWYKVDGTGLGMKATTCSDATDFNAALAVFEGVCGELRCIDGNEYAYESTCGSTSGYGNSEVSWGTSQGTTYYVLVNGGYQNSGNFGLTISEFQNAPHDVCDDALVVSPNGEVVSGSIVNATPDFPSGSGCGNTYFDGPGIWFRVAGTGSGLRASTCNVNSRSQSSLSVYTGTCDDLSCVAGANADYSYGCSTASWMSTDSTDYYIYAHVSRYDNQYTDDIGNQYTGDIGLSVEEFEPAVNDMCDGAETLAVGGSVVVGSTADATQDSIPEDYCYFPYGGYYGGGVEAYAVADDTYPPNNQNTQVGDVRYIPVGQPGVWYTVEGTGSGLRASTCSSHTATYVSIVVFSGECGNLSCVNSTMSYPACDESYNARAASWISESGASYYVYVSGYEVGTFGISVSEFTPPQNQVCQNAIGPITPNSDAIQGSNIGAVFDGVNSCFDYYTSSGVWYTVIGTGESLRASTCGPNTTFDTYLSVYSGECDNLVCIGGNDDACSSLSSAVVWPSVDGTQYYVRVSGYGDASGDFGFEIDEVVPPANDLCANAVAILPGVPVEGSLLVATSDSVPYCSYPSGSSGIWYEVTGNGNAFSLSTCSPKTQLYAQISVYVGSCGDLDCVDELFVDSSSVCEHSYYGSSSVSWLSKEGEVYKVFVSNEYGETGDFELTLTEFQVSDNDVCEDATPVSPSDVTIFGTTLSATGGDDDPCQGLATSPGVWYKINGVEGQFLRASTCVEETSIPTVMSVLSGTCGSLACIESRYSYESYSSNCGSNGVTIDWEFVNSMYYVLIYTADGERGGNFGLTIRELVRPSNDDCLGAIPMEVDGQNVVGSISDATREMDVYYCGVSIDSPGVWYKIDGTGSGIAVSTCSNVTNFETAISVFSGSCDNLECIGGSSYYECSQSQYSTSRMAWASSADETYYVLVHSVSYYGGSSAYGTFEMTVTSFTPPANDVCSGAIDVVAGGSSVVGSTLDASLELNVNCGFYGDAPGVWYKVVGTGNGMRASTCSFMTDFDSSLSVFSGSCDEQTCIAGSSWDPNCASRGSTASWIAEADVTYYILVLGSYSSALGNFELSIAEFTPAENDQCGGAIDIEVDGSATTGTLSGATLDASEQEYCVVQAYGPGVWYTVTGNGLAFRASTCGSYYGSVSTGISVFSGDCETATCVAGNSWDSSCEYYGGSTVSWASELGTMYNILVHGTDSGQTGTFELSLTSFEPPENDECKNAISIVADGDEIVGSQADATSDEIEAPSCGTYTQKAGVWYTISGTGSGLRASTCSSSTTYDTALSVYEGECGALRCITGNDDDLFSCASADYSYSTSTVSWFAEAGETYYMFVHAGYSGSGVFGLNITSFVTSDNDVCEDGAPIAVGSVTSGSTFDATVDGGVPSECFYYFDKGSSGPGVWYTVIGTGSTMTASTCSRTGGNEVAPIVLSGSCSNLTCPFDNNWIEYNSGCSGYYGGYNLSWESEEDVEYYILVFGTYSSVPVQFDLSLTSGGSVENDDCPNAIPLSSSMFATSSEGTSISITGSTIGASQSDFDACDSASDSGGVWYTMEGSGMMVTAATCGDQTTFDTQISVYSGSCDDLNCIVVNDDYCGLQSIATWEAKMDVQYYIKVHGFSGSAGQFELTTSAQTIIELENDLCNDALEIIPTAEGAFVSGSTLFATEDIFDVLHCGTFIVNPGVWYRVLGTGSAIEASTCSDVTNYYTAISVFSGDCDDLSCIVGATDDKTCALSNFASSVRWFATSGTTYLILVHGHDNPAVGEFGLTVRTIESPSNDVCESAESISVGVAVSASTITATFENYYWSDCGIFVDSPSLWYTVEGTGLGLEASTCSNVTDFGTSMGVFTGDCGSLQCVDVFQSEICGSSSAVQWKSDVDAPYYIVVFGTASDDTGTLALSVSEFSAVDNDVCETAMEIEVGSETNGSTTMATVDSGVERCDDATEATSNGVWYRTTGNGQSYVASTCDGSDFDTQISVYSGGCDGALVCVAGNDQSCGDQSVVTWDTTADTVYYILVHGWSSFYGNFTLKLETA